MELTIDPKIGDGLIAANERTIKELGLSYKGKEVVLDNKLGDNVLSCNQRTYDSLLGSVSEPVKAPKVEDKVEPDVDDGDDGGTIEGGDPPVMTGLKRITIKVTWLMQNNEDTSLEVMTYLSKKQVNQLDRMFGE